MRAGAQGQGSKIPLVGDPVQEQQERLARGGPAQPAVQDRHVGLLAHVPHLELGEHPAQHRRHVEHALPVPPVAQVEVEVTGLEPASHTVGHLREGDALADPSFPGEQGERAASFP